VPGRSQRQCGEALRADRYAGKDRKGTGQRLVSDAALDRLAAHLLDLETALLRQEVRADAAQLERVIADDFFEFGVSGQVWSKPAIIAALRDESFSERR